jgi:hypothetical protein
MKSIKSIASAAILALVIATPTFAKSGTISGTKTGTISGTRTGTISGTRTGTISGTRTGTISGTRTGTISGTRGFGPNIPATSTDSIPLALFELLMTAFQVW